MLASELIEEIQSIIVDTNSDPEIDEYWLRAILNLNITHIINMRTGKPVLKVVEGNDDIGS